MKKVLGVMLFAVAFVVGASAQTVVRSDTFTFTTGVTISRYATPPTGGQITAWDGVPNKFPENMGGVALANLNAYGSSIEAPWQLGYLNNGYLNPCDPLPMAGNTLAGTRTYTVGDGTHSGDMFSVTASTTCPYFTGEYGGNSANLLDGFTVTANYTVFKYQTCYRGRCTTVTVNFLTGGSGTLTESMID